MIFVVKKYTMEKLKKNFQGVIFLRQRGLKMNNLALGAKWSCLGGEMVLHRSWAGPDYPTGNVGTCLGPPPKGGPQKAKSKINKIKRFNFFRKIKIELVLILSWFQS